MSTEAFRKKAREKALKEYDAGWNLRPVKPAPVERVNALCAEATALRWVRWLTLAESKDDHGGAVRLLVGVRVTPNGPLTYRQAEARLMEAAASAGAVVQELRFAQLDDEVDFTMADGSLNPYVVFGPPEWARARE